MSDNQHNTPHPTYNSLDDAVDEAMKFLEPPSNEELTLESVARAHAILQQAAACESNKSGCHPNHPRILQIQSILQNTTCNENEEWMQSQTDFYRALLLSSFLWLELMNGDDAATTRRILQSTVERSLLLLQVLYGIHHDTLPTSRHVLLQAVLDEPLIPLDQQERQLSYILQKRKREDLEEDELMNNDNDDDFMVGTMNRKELVREEEELLKLAMKPVPAKKSDDNGGVTAQEDASHKDGLVHGGPLLWIQANSPKTCHVSVYDCGLLTATSTTTSSQDDGTMKNDRAWLLSPSSTCEIQTDDNNQSVHLLIVKACHTVTTSPFQVHENVCPLEYKVESTSQGQEWKSCIENVIQSLQDADKLQKELQQEWKEEYQAVFMGTTENIAMEE